MSTPVPVASRGLAWVRPGGVRAGASQSLVFRAFIFQERQYVLEGMFYGLRRDFEMRTSVRRSRGARWAEGALGGRRAEAPGELRRAWRCAGSHGELRGSE